MKTLTLACLAAAVLIFVFYRDSWNQAPSGASASTAPATLQPLPPQAPTPEVAPPLNQPPPIAPRPAPGAPAAPAATAAPEHWAVTNGGSFVFYSGHVVQRVSTGLLLKCVQTLNVGHGEFALDHPWHNWMGESEIDGDFVLRGDPGEAKPVTGNKVYGIAELGPPFSVIVQGKDRTVRSLRWVEPTTVKNYQPGRKAFMNESHGSLLNLHP